MPPGPPGYPPQQGPPPGETNTLATLSVVFAFVFAPVGVVLGHMALSQIAGGGQRGRERALVGLTLSYLMIVVAVLALVIWLVGGSSGSTQSDTTAATPTTTTSRTTTTPPPPRTTVITPPPQQRPTVDVEDLRVGDCVEVQRTNPDPNNPNADFIFIYRVPCEPRDGVFQVDQIVPTNVCETQALYSTLGTMFACISNYRG